MDAKSLNLHSLRDIKSTPPPIPTGSPVISTLTILAYFSICHDFSEIPLP